MADDQVMDELVDFSAEDQLELLRSNTLALAAGTISFLRTQGIPATAWTQYLGGVFARGWDTDQPWTPEDFLDATILSLSAFGGEAVQAEFGDDDATARIAGFPDLERIEGLGMQDVDTDIVFDLIGPIARACGIRYEWWRDGEHVRIQVHSQAPQ